MINTLRKKERDLTGIKDGDPELMTLKLICKR
jgi:hypothetical protein